VTIAVNDRLVSDTTGRNALNKIHVSLGKIVANMGEAEVGSRRISRSMSVATEDKTGSEDRTALTEPRIKEEEEEDASGHRGDEDSDEGTVIPEKEMSMDSILTDDGA
jgi:condensin complex subunit 3